MRVKSQPDSPGVGGGLDYTSSQSKSYDTIGTIPCVRANTAAPTPGETSEAFVARSTVEVRSNESPLEVPHRGLDQIRGLRAAFIIDK